MSIKGGGKLLRIVIFLSLAVSTTIAASSSNAFADSFASTGDNLHSSAGTQCEIKINGNNYSVGGWTVDTCFGMSWVYYKWPTDANGNPIDSDIHFACTGGTCASGRTESIVTKECGKPENGSGFWYLGFEAYSSEGKYYLNSLGYQVGKPKVLYLTQWLRAPGIGTETGTYITGLYPVTIFGNKYINTAFQGSYSPMTSEYLTLSSEALNASYTPAGKLKGPGKCSDYGLTDKKCTYKASAGGWFVQPFPYIIVNGARKTVEGEYYGTTRDVKADWDELNEDHIVTSADDGSTISSSDFAKINYFCSGRTSKLSGRSGVKVGSGTAQYSKWTNEENPATVNASSVVDVSDKVDITFYHHLRGKGQTQATISVNQASLKSKDVNNKENWKDRTWNFVGITDAFDENKTVTRTRTVTKAELEAISSGTTTVCDTMTFGAQTSKACVSLKPVSAIENLVTTSTATVPNGSTATSEAKKGALTGQTKTVDYNITVDGSAQTVNVQFNHILSVPAQTNPGTASVNYTISQTTSGSGATIGSYSTTSGTKNVTVSSQVPVPTVTAANPTIAVTGVTATTNVTVCQKMVASYNGSNYTTTVCAHIKGNNFAVSGQSSVVSDTSSATTGFVNNNNVARTSRTIYAPYNANASTTATFKHELKAVNSVSTSFGTGSISYTIKRGSNNVKSSSYSFANTSTNTATVYNEGVSVSGGETCQTLSFTYNSYSGNPQACITINYERPTFAGSSTVSGGGYQETVTTNNGSKTLTEIKIPVAAGKTRTQSISFSHDITARSNRSDARNQSTGTMPFTVEKDYTNNYSNNFSGTFPNSGSIVVTKGVSSGSTSVEVQPGQSKTVCESLTFSGWKSTVCAKVTGILSLPEVQSQTSAKYSSTIKASDWATKSAPNKSAETIKVTVPIMPSVDMNGGINVPITFTHDIKAALTGTLAEQNTGTVNYTYTTTGATDNTAGSGNFVLTVKTASPSASINPKVTSNKYVNARIGATQTACQTLTFTYDGVTRNTTACVEVRGISADPKGISKITVNGCGHGVTADTDYVDGAIAWLDVYSCTKDDIKGSDIVFNHGFSTGGEMSVTVPFGIENSCTANNDGCVNNYSKPYNQSTGKPNYSYTGHTGTARANIWLYNKLNADGSPTNTYNRSPAISDQDAKTMFGTGAVCETLSYEFDGVWHTTTACVRFNNPNSPCPDLGTAGTTRSTSYVKKYLGTNLTSPTPDGTTVVYAKPTDNIEFTHCYYPGAQATRYTNDDESKYNNAGNNGKLVLIPLRNAFVEQQNQFTINNQAGTDNYVNNQNRYTFTQYGQILQDAGNSTFTGVIGNPNHTALVSSKTSISTQAVGKEFSQSLYDHPGTNAVSGHDTANCGAGCTVRYRNSDDNKWYNIVRRNSDSPVSESSSAKVIVPYNYRTTASVNTGNGFVYAGESVSGQDVNVLVNQRFNATVNDTYATKTPESTVRLYLFYTANTNPTEGSDHQSAGSNVNACSYYGGIGFSGCIELPTKEGASASGIIFNSSSNINPTNPEKVNAFRSDYNVPDLPAGSKVCMGVTVYPAESTDTLPENGNTFVSKAYCRTVAKKPTFQVWGGGVYSAGDIVSNQFTKYTVDGVLDYTLIRPTGAPSLTFGSWVEHAVIANGTATGLASGAATGYGQKGLVVNAANPGGSTSSNYCNLNRLSLANVNCISKRTGSFGVAGVSASKTTLKEKYANKAAAIDASRNNDQNAYVNLNLSNANSYTEQDGVRYTFANTNLTLDASNRLPSGVMHVIYAKGNVVIRSNLLYQDSNLQNMSSVPQYLIVADGNIYIEPAVTRIDAILLAGKNLNTCAKLSGSSVTEATKASGTHEVENLYCARQLKINGVIIADVIKFYRIYGASNGLNSIVPAEIVDFSPSLYMWGSSETDSTFHKGIYTTYQRELAPRQ